MQGDLVSKRRKGLASKDFIDRYCNCNSTKKVNVMCVYGSECFICYVVYKVTCKCCGDLNVENTQNAQKKKGTTLPRCAPEGHSI